PAREKGRSILRQYADTEQRATRTSITDAALEKIDRLHRRYATYSAYPGRPLRFVRNLLHDSSQQTRTWPLESDEATSAFARETGLPRCLLDEAAPLDLEATRQ